ncbi:MAG: HAMP domain-containing protein [Oxalobacter sp.]|nr:MAG: HAMP domain-containing protein [Oxalobacter sp.]
MKMSNLKIATRLKLLSLFLIVAVLFSGATGWQALSENKGHFKRFVEVSQELEHAADTARKSQVDFKIQIQEWKNILLRGGTPDGYRKYKDAFEKKGKAVQSGLAELEKAYAKHQLDTALIKDAIKATQEINEKYMAALAKHDLAKAGSAHSIDKMVQGMDRAPNEKIDKIVMRTLEAANQYTREAEKQLDSRFNKTLIMLLLVVLSGVLLGAFMTLKIVSGITRSLNYAVLIAQRVTNGDLTGSIDVESTDEVGKLLEALRDMNNALQNVVWHVRQGVDTFNLATNEIAAGNQNLSSRTEEQASSLEQTASSMEELTSTVRQNADNARQANQLAATASGVAVKSGEVVAQVVHTMSDIHASSRKIADIINVIDGIAFQTNILALNAAVEAARAGEQGRGFAVVATEVRNLAQRSAEAAKEIKSLIDDSVGKIDNGNRLVNQAGATMDEVVTSVKRVTDIMAEISAASKEQSDGIEQVNQAITQMDAVTQQNAALVEQAAAAAESLKGQATELANVVSVFKVKSEKYGTTDEAAEMVRKAVSYLKEHGREKGFAEICNRLGRFNDRDLYVVVYDLNGRNLAHGAFPAMVGRDLIDAKDGAGKFYVRERLDIVKANEKGWQNYTFTNPVTKQMEPKAMYLERLEDYIVGCGAYTKG